MKITIKKKEDIDVLREGGKILSKIMKETISFIKPGVSTYDIDKLVFDLIKKNKGTPSFLNYRPASDYSPFPGSACVSVNDEIVHGIPNKNRILKEGDIVSVDIGLKYKGCFTDHAVTVGVGKIKQEDKLLLEATKEALSLAIKSARGGAHIGDIGFAIESFVNNRYGIVRELAGHGVGYKVHEDPYVPNYGKPGSGEKLVPGMVIDIEPMICMGQRYIKSDDDGWTIRTKDRKNSAHFEHTILITEKGPEVLTK